MANLAIVGSHSTNGVAAIHSELLRTTTVKDLAEMFPSVLATRQWRDAAALLVLANRRWLGSITEAIGDGWVTDLRQLSQLTPLADDKGFAAASAGPSVRPSRSSLLGSNPRPARRRTRTPSLIARSSASTNTSGNCSMPAHRGALQPAQEQSEARDGPRTFFFAGKAAPAYRLAKLIIKFLENLAATIEADGAMRGKIKVLFLPEYDVSLAERLIAASDVSNQISTAGYEASGTSNMKFMMNGALTIGTRDGATIEMAEEAGQENFFLFGLTASSGQQPWLVRSALAL